MKKQITSILLIAATTLASVACGGGSATSTETTAPSGETTAEVTTSAPEYVPEAKDFKGYEFKMLIPKEGQGLEYFESDEATGDVVNDAVFEMQENVKELYNITFNNTPHGTYWADKDALMNLIRNSVLADDDAFDVAFPAYYYGQQLVLEGNFIDMNTLDGLHLDEDWWVSGYNDQAQFDGKLYGAVGDYGLTDLNAQMVIYYNKRMYEELKYENIYDLVRDGKWTLDKLIELSTAVGKDLNGDGTVGMEDQLGYLVNTNGIRAFTVNAGIKFADFDNDGTPYISLSSEKTYDLYEKVYNFINKTDDALWNAPAEADYIKPFMDGRVLFMTYKLGISSTMRAMNDDFGIIPMPKYDEEQENYITYTAGPNIAVIPRSANDPERTATVLDALNYYSSKLVVPAYYEVALKSKYARDNDTAEMLDLIKDSVFYDFGFIYGTPLGGIADDLGNSLANGLENYASRFASAKAGYDSKMEALIEELKALG